MRRLAVLILVNLALALALLRAPWRADDSLARSSRPAAEAESAAPAPATPATPPPDARLFTNRPLPPPPPPVAPAAAPPAEPGVEITGILFDGGGWQAIGRRPDGRPVAVRTGDVLDGWRVRAITRTTAEFERGGERWTASIEPKP